MSEPTNQTPQDFLRMVRELLESRRSPSSKRSVNAPQSVSEQVEESIKRLITKGVYTPGMRLLETELASEFGVSRAPIRDALRMLDKQGFVDLVPRKGATVYQPTAEDITNLYEVRAEIFALAARKAASSMDAETSRIAQIGLQISLELAEADEGEFSSEDFLTLRNGLAALILFAANNPRLTEFVNTLGMRATTHLQIFQSDRHRLRNARNWQKIYAAIFEQDQDRAASEARNIVLDARDELLSQMRTNQQEANIRPKA